MSQSQLQLFPAEAKKFKKGDARFSTAEVLNSLPDSDITEIYKDLLTNAIHQVHPTTPSEPPCILPNKSAKPGKYPRCSIPAYYYNNIQDPSLRRRVLQAAALPPAKCAAKAAKEAAKQAAKQAKKPTKQSKKKAKIAPASAAPSAPEKPQLATVPANEILPGEYEEATDYRLKPYYHQVAFRAMVGKLPVADEEQVEHTCRMGQLLKTDDGKEVNCINVGRGCFNPKHLRAATRYENISRNYCTPYAQCPVCSTVFNSCVHSPPKCTGGDDPAQVLLRAQAENFDNIKACKLWYTDGTEKYFEVIPATVPVSTPVNTPAPEPVTKM